MTRRHFLIKHGVTLVVALVGVGLTGAVVQWRSADFQRAAGEIMDQRSLFVTEAVRRSVQATQADAAGAAGLFMASEEVTEDEFEVFAESVGRLEGNLGLAYVPVVSEHALSDFLRSVRDSDPAFEVFAVGPDGGRLVAEPNGPHYPVRYLAQGPSLTINPRGLDAGTDPVWVEVLERAAESGGVSVSPPAPLFGDPDLWGFLVVAPIGESGQVTGFAVSLFRVDALVEAKLAASLSDVVDWSVTDITTAPLSPESPAPLRRTEILEVGDRLWRVEVVPTESAQKALLGGSTWPTVLMGLLLTTVVAVSVHVGMGMLRTREENAELRRLTEEKDEFMSAISHELRTPLTVVVGMAEILEESTLGSDPEVREYVSLLRQQGGELARLVDNLLLLGRLDAEVLYMAPEQVDLSWELERIIREVETPSHLAVLIEGEAEVWADPLRLRHVIRHLHTNAIRHADHRVTYRLALGPREVRLAVVDDGQGVPNVELPNLFTAASGKKDTPGGPTTLGLGLRVSKRLAVALGGDLTYRRTATETVFELRLPKSPTDGAELATGGISTPKRSDAEARR